MSLPPTVMSKHLLYQIFQLITTSQGGLQYSALGCCGPGPQLHINTTTSLLGFGFPFAFAGIVGGEDVVRSLLSEGLLVVRQAVHVVPSN